MKKTKLPLLIGLTLLTSQQAQSAVAFGDISGTATAPGATFVNFVLGYDFTVGADPIDVFAFGYFDPDGGTLDVGAQIGIYLDADGPGGNDPVLQGSLSIDASRVADRTVNATNGNYSYFDLVSPIQLAANTTYRLAAAASDGTNGNTIPGPSISPTNVGTGISIDTSVDYVATNGTGGSLQYPGASAFSPGFDAPLGNFEFNVVPEPSSMTLLALAGIGLLRRRR